MPEPVITPYRYAVIVSALQQITEAVDGLRADGHAVGYPWSVEFEDEDGTYVVPFSRWSGYYAVV